MIEELITFFSCMCLFDSKPHQFTQDKELSRGKNGTPQD